MDSNRSAGMSSENNFGFESKCFLDLKNLGEVLQRGNEWSTDSNNNVILTILLEKLKNNNCEFFSSGKVDSGNDVLVTNLTEKIEVMRLKCSDLTDENNKLQNEYDKAKDEVTYMIKDLDFIVIFNSNTMKILIYYERIL